MDTRKQIRDKILRNVRRRVKSSLTARAIVLFEQAKRALLQEVENHPVSKELRAKTNPSSFLSAKKGSLFGFLGFNSNDDPVGDLIDFLDINVNYRFSDGTVAGSVVAMNISIPARREFKNNLPLSWTSGLSWVDAIEDGVSGLPFFLSKNDEGRSDEGVQAKGIVSGAEFTGTPFISELLARFRVRVIGQSVI